MELESIVEENCAVDFLTQFCCPLGKIGRTLNLTGGTIHYAIQAVSVSIKSMHMLSCT